MAILRAVQRGKRVDDADDAELAVQLAASLRRILAIALTNRARVVSFVLVIAAAALQALVLGGGLIRAAAVGAVLVALQLIAQWRAARLVESLGRAEDANRELARLVGDERAG